MPLVSIIIRTKNEAKHLGDLLEMLKKQTYTDLEIILVDSGSTDGTLEIAKKYGVRIIKIRPEDFTFPYASNIGAENAQGKYLVYISGHCLPLSEKWIEDGVRIMENDFVSAAVSPCLMRGTAASLRSASQSSMRDCDGDELKKYKDKIIGVYCQPVYPLADASRF
ncbi:MAG: glycosyltransferase family A protein, partial [bacterium]